MTEEQYAAMFYKMDSLNRIKVKNDLLTQLRAIERAEQGQLKRQTLTPLEKLMFDYKIFQFVNNKYNHFITPDNIQDFAVFDSFDKNSQGVYFIDDLYIGKSKDIEQRIMQHITDAFFYYLGDCEKISNPEKSERIIEVLEVRKLFIKKLSNNMADEPKLIKKHGKKYDLTNIDFNDYGNRKKALNSFNNRENKNTFIQYLSKILTQE